MAKTSAKKRVGKSETNGSVDGGRIAGGLSKRSRSTELAEGGFDGTGDFIALMRAVLCDTITGAVSPQVCSAASGAGRVLLKAVELQLKYSSPPRKQCFDVIGSVLS